MAHCPFDYLLFNMKREAKKLGYVLGSGIDQQKPEDDYS